MAALPIPPEFGVQEPEMFPPGAPPGMPPGPIPPEAVDLGTPQDFAMPPAQEEPYAPDPSPAQLPPDNTDPYDYDDRPAPHQVAYDWGHCCSSCDHYMPPEGCALVNGHIRPDGVCKLFTLRPGMPSDPILGD